MLPWQIIFNGGFAEIRRNRRLSLGGGSSEKCANLRTNLIVPQGNEMREQGTRGEERKGGEGGWGVRNMK